MRRCKIKKSHATLTIVLSTTVFMIMLLSACAALSLFFAALHFNYINITLPKPIIRTIPLIAMAITSLVIGAVLSWLIGRILLKPIRKIVGATNRIARGDFSARLSIQSPLEFAELTKSFNNMATELGSIEMLRSDFINDFSHEFKTPIVSIAGFAKMLKKSGLSEKERNECIDVIVAESERLSELSNNILNLTKIEKQAIIADKKQYNLSEQLRRVVLLLEPKWSAKSLEIEFDGPECSINANEELLKQVWINMLDNAIKFSPEYSEIIISLKAGEDIEVTFRDYGCGISEKAKSRIFDKFYQEDTSHSTPGNGLGLAICKNIVEKHGGKITLSSEIGKGTEFTIILPKNDK